MDIFSVLKKDHSDVKALVARIERAGGSAVRLREKLYLKLRSDLLAHAKAEEAVVYTKLLDSSKERNRADALEATEEHGVIEDLFKKLDGCSPSDERFDAILTVLKE